MAGQRSVRLAERGTGALLLSDEAGYQINKSPGRVPGSTLAHIWKHGLSPVSLLVPDQLLHPFAQRQSGLHQLYKGGHESFPCVPRSLSASLPLSHTFFTIPPPPSLLIPAPKSFPSFWICFTAAGLPQNNYLNPRDLTVWE